MYTDAAILVVHIKGTSFEGFQQSGGTEDNSSFLEIAICMQVNQIVEDQNKLCEPSRLAAINQLNACRFYIQGLNASNRCKGEHMGVLELFDASHVTIVSLLEEHEVDQRNGGQQLHQCVCGGVCVCVFACLCMSACVDRASS